MEKINNKFLALAGIVIVIIAGASLALLSNKDSSNNNINPTSNPKQKEYTIIRMPNESTWVTLATVAEEKGFFEEVGIKIEWTGKIAGGGPGQLASIAGGSNDIGSAAVMAIINAINKGVKIKAVGPEYELDEVSSTKWFVLENSNIKSAKDLIGKKIAVNTLKANAEYTIKEYLSQNSIPFDKVELLVVDGSRVGNPFLAEGLLRKGEVDMISVSEVTEWKLLTKGGVRRITSNYEVWGKASGNPAYVVSEDFMKNYPDATRKFVSALAKAADYINANQDDALRITIKRNYGNIDPDAAKQIKTKSYPEHALISEEQVKQWIDRMVKYGDIKEGQIKPSDIYTSEFNPYFKR